MRKPEDGDIEPTKESIKAAYELLKNVVELIGDDDENAAELKNDMEMMKKQLVMMGYIPIVIVQILQYIKEINAVY